jgi:hypothetical protein
VPQRWIHVAIVGTAFVVAAIAVALDAHDRWIAPRDGRSRSSRTS